MAEERGTYKRLTWILYSKAEKCRLGRSEDLENLMNDETSCGRLECTYIPSGGAAEQAAERKYHNISDIERLRIESRPS